MNKKRLFKSRCLNFFIPLAAAAGVVGVLMVAQEEKLLIFIFDGWHTCMCRRCCLIR
jgi:hypothetical protein